MNMFRRSQIELTNADLVTGVCNFVCVWCAAALSDPRSWHVRVLPAVDQVRRLTPVKLAEESQSWSRGALPLCCRRLQPRINLTR